MGPRGEWRGRPGWNTGHRGTDDQSERPNRANEDRDESGDAGSTELTGSTEQFARSRQRYPWHDDPDYVRPERGSARLPPLPTDHPARREPEESSEEPPDEPSDEPRSRRTPPEKLTVTRVAAWRGRELTERLMRLFFSAAQADGADRSGLARFTYGVMFNYAVDAAMAVALANTLFFSAATGESKGRVALYLLITVAPFAMIAPVIGPALDRLQRGRRAALATSFTLRVLLALVMALNFDSWLLYPAALGSMVLSKSFGVLRAAMTPRVLPEEITLTKANSRLTTFGLVAGGVFGAVASGIAALAGSEGALCYMAVLAGVGTWMCLRIPDWVESTEGEVPARISGASAGPTGSAAMTGDVPTGNVRTGNVLSGHVVVALWGNGGIRLLTGFLTLFAAFVIKGSTQQAPITQLVLLGLVGGAAGAGNFLGNALGARMHFDKPDRLILACLGSALAVTVCAALMAGYATAVLVGLVGSTASSLAKVCLDAVVQRDMPERSRASAFGRSETVLQLSWVFGGALGVLLPPVFWIGFTLVAALLALGTAQTVVAGRGGTLVPRIRRPARPNRSDRGVRTATAGTDAPEPGTERSRPGS